MTFSHHQTRIVKAMLARGDKQHDIAAFFGVNGGRIAEVANGNCDFPSAPPIEVDKLPPKGPYASPYEIVRALKELETIEKALGEASKTDEMQKVLPQIEKVKKLLKP